jgi:Holliday junction resolvasome RuvABC endonuclease subunit
MRVLGIDPGIANVGFGAIEQWRGEVYHSTKYRVIASGCLITSPRTSQHRRIYSIARRIKYLIEATEPDVIVVENFVPFSRHKSIGSISQAFGAIQYVCVDSKVKLVIVASNLWMRGLLGLKQKDRMGKRMIQRFVDKQLRIRTRVEHEAEALGMALYYLRRSR